MYTRSLRRVKSIGMRVAHRLAVSSEFVRKLTLLGSLLVASPVFACRFVYCAQRLAPGDGWTVPANAQFVVAQGKTHEWYDAETDSVTVWRPFVRRVDSDGGVQQLQAAPLSLQPTDDFGDATLFALGPVSPGDRVRLESSRDCGLNPEPFAEVRVAEAAPSPSRLGTPLSPPAHRMEPTTQLACSSDEFEEPFVRREVQLELDDSVRPWLGLARVHLEVNGRQRSTDYGRLARGFDGGAVVLVERVVRICDSETVETWPVRLELEIPGVTERPPPVDFTVEMDCRPSCATAGGDAVAGGSVAVPAAQTFVNVAGREQIPFGLSGVRRGRADAAER